MLVGDRAVEQAGWVGGSVACRVLYQHASGAGHSHSFRWWTQENG